MFSKEKVQSKLITTDQLFNETTFGWLVVLVTTFLQIISLATTFEGSKVYFGGVKLPFFLSAPLLFSLAVQLTVFCTSHIIRRHFKIWLIVILLFSTLSSTYFSYIGIYNHINSPISYLKERYGQIYDDLTQKYQGLEEQVENTMKSYVFDFVSTLDNSYGALALQVEENNTLTQKANSVQMSEGLINPLTNTLQKPNKASFGDNLDAYYEAMAKYNATLGTMVSDTAKQESNLKTELFENEVKAILGGKTKEEFTTQSIATTTKKEQVQKLIHSMYLLLPEHSSTLSPSEELSAIQEYTLSIISNREENLDSFSTLLTQLYTALELLNLQEKHPTFKEDLGHFTALRSKDTQLMRPLKTIEMDVYKEVHGASVTSSYLTEKEAMPFYTALESEIKNAASLINQLELLETPIDLTAPTYTLFNLYVLPIKNLLVKGSSQTMAWFSLCFAILVDGLSLIFALINAKEKTPLFAKHNKDIIGHSKEAVENLLLSTIQASSPKGSSLNENLETLHYLESFMKNFKLFPVSMNSGYSMWCHLSHVGDYQVFLSILCQFNLASIVSAQELNEVLVTPSNEERYVLIKTKFIIWVNQKIAELKKQEEVSLMPPLVEKGYALEGE